MEKKFVNQTVLQLTLRRWAELFSDRHLYIMIAICIVGLTVVSPLGFSGEQGLYGRLALALTGTVICWTVGLLVHPPARILFEVLGVRHPYSILISGPLTALMVLPVLIWVLDHEFPGAPSTERMAELAALISLVIITVCYVLSAQPAISRPDEDAASEDNSPSTETEQVQRPSVSRIHQRIPALKRGTLFALVAQDHYVDIITDNGRELVLMRLSDAIDLSDDHDGLRIHRSAWVSREGLHAVHKNGRKVLVELPDGSMLPVARSAEAKLKKFVDREQMRYTEPAPA